MICPLVELWNETITNSINYRGLGIPHKKEILLLKDRVQKRLERLKY